MMKKHLTELGYSDDMVFKFWNKYLLY
jgi:hypothetical protein